MLTEIHKISKKYDVKVIGKEKIAEIYELYEGNPNYFKHVKSELTNEVILQDLNGLPKGKDYDDKFYVGFYQGDSLVAVMDLISAYPNEVTAFIGFFMMNKAFQGQGIGTEIIDEAIAFLREKSFRYVRLGYVQTNSEAKAFWLKNKFSPTGVEIQTDKYTIIVMQREI